MSDKRVFKAELSGENEVPPVETRAKGSAKASVNADATVINASVFVKAIQGVTQAHIHLGAEGVNGPVVAFLFGPSDPVDVPKRGRRLACRTLTRGDLVGPLEGQPLSALVDAMAADNTYVNVHTVANPGGEVRGQLEKDD